MSTSTPPKAPWLPLSGLSENQVTWVAEYVKNTPLFKAYHDCAIEDLNRGLDNRLYLIADDNEGLIMGIRFDDANVLSPVGAPSQETLARMFRLPERTELHVERRHEKQLGGYLERRNHDTGRIRYYRLTDWKVRRDDERCRVMGRKDEADLSQLFAEHYPDAVVSEWMLDLPFVGVWEGSQLVAAAGTLAMSADSSVCHIGNFLTRPDCRGRGLARIAGSALLGVLARRGIETFMLGVGDDNDAAWHVCEQLGFSRFGMRQVLFLEAK